MKLQANSAGVRPCPVGAPERQGLCHLCCDHGSLSTAENSHDTAISLLTLGDDYEREIPKAWTWLQHGSQRCLGSMDPSLAQKWAVCS